MPGWLSTYPSFFGYNTTFVQRPHGSDGRDRKIMGGFPIRKVADFLLLVWESGSRQEGLFALDTQQGNYSSRGQAVRTMVESDLGSHPKAATDRRIARQ